MSTLHTFGCSITQGFALPDTINIQRDQSGRVLTAREVEQKGIHWTEIHINRPSDLAWPAVLARRLGCTVENYARRGSCFQQIAQQCVLASPRIRPEDTVIVMWTYLSRLSLQWPARTSVPYANLADPDWNWRTRILGFNNDLGLLPSKHADRQRELQIQEWIYQSTRYTYLDPRGIYDRYYRSLILQITTDGLLRSTGARIIHLSVEAEPVLDQLELARRDLDPTLSDPYTIPDPNSWYTLCVDYDTGAALRDPKIPPAENDMHPSQTHHSNFADRMYDRYFRES